MSRALIITSHVEHLELVNISYSSFDAVICADAGLAVAEKLRIKPDYLIGDYDSIEKPEIDGVIVLPTEKDITDSEAAIDMALSMGFDSLTLLGGIGGRFDHTMGNLGMLAKHTTYKTELKIVDGQNMIFMMLPGEAMIPKFGYKYLGLISYGDTVKGLTVSGTKYTLKNYNLHNDTSLGVSNEITDSFAKIRFESGKLLVILTRDIPKQNIRG